MKTKLPALLLTLTLSLTACGAAPAATGSQSAPDLSGAHALPQTMEETPPVDLPTLRLTLVDGAGTDTLLLAGETAGEVYTVPADSFPLTLDGEPLSLCAGDAALYHRVCRFFSGAHNVLA